MEGVQPTYQASQHSPLSHRTAHSTSFSSPQGTLQQGLLLGGYGVSEKELVQALSSWPATRSWAGSSTAGGIRLAQIAIRGVKAVLTYCCQEQQLCWCTVPHLAVHQVLNHSCIYTHIHEHLHIHTEKKNVKPALKMVWII